uniref:PH domain-containing protein n=1 Tax=Phaeomonas parva TaxID=124430 RepID=A0A7S1XX32_9STRA|mmetsp:Transcript_5491/g.15316  ORF Transcript_5491/g.15316 Transcript_5491/m.15316 type:complete len:125 (+) Transcript_5491:71-445(+)
MKHAFPIMWQTGNISLVEEVAVEGPSATEFSIEIMHKYYIIKAPSRDAAKIWVEGLKSRQSTSSPDPAAAGMAEGRMDYISGLKGNSTAEQLLTAAALTKASAMSTKYNEDEKGVYNCCGCLVW